MLLKLNIQGSETMKQFKANQKQNKKKSTRNLSVGHRYSLQRKKKKMT